MFCSPFCSRSSSGNIGDGDLRAAEEARETIDRLEREHGRLKARIASLEAKSRTKPVSETTPPPAATGTGYIELRRIGFKQCNLGPEFEK